jgi:hypothetical protein
LILKQSKQIFTEIFLIAVFSFVDCEKVSFNDGDDSMGIGISMPIKVTVAIFTVDIFV